MCALPAQHSVAAARNAERDASITSAERRMYWRYACPLSYALQRRTLFVHSRNGALLALLLLALLSLKLSLLFAHFRNGALLGCLPKLSLLYPLHRPCAPSRQLAARLFFARACARAFRIAFACRTSRHTLGGALQCAFSFARVSVCARSCLRAWVCAFVRVRVLVCAHARALRIAQACRKARRASGDTDKRRGGECAVCGNARIDATVVLFSTRGRALYDCATSLFSCSQGQTKWCTRSVCCRCRIQRERASSTCAQAARASSRVFRQRMRYRISASTAMLRATVSVGQCRAVSDCKLFHALRLSGSYHTVYRVASAHIDTARVLASLDRLLDITSHVRYGNSLDALALPDFCAALACPPLYGTASPKSRSVPTSMRTGNAHVRVVRRLSPCISVCLWQARDSQFLFVFMARGRQSCAFRDPLRNRPNIFAAYKKEGSVV
eukprot:IDg95t1